MAGPGNKKTARLAALAVLSGSPWARSAASLRQPAQEVEIKAEKPVLHCVHRSLWWAFNHERQRRGKPLRRASLPNQQTAAGAANAGNANFSRLRPNLWPSLTLCGVRRAPFARRMTGMCIAWSGSGVIAFSCTGLAA